MINLLNKEIDVNYIVFLDIDGVLNVFHNPKVDFEPESIKVLNDLYDKVKYKIVLSSSWKESWPVYYLQELFKEIGIQAPLIDVTKTYFNNDETIFSGTLYELENIETNDFHSREYEIKQWVNLYGVNNYIILDDMEIKDKELSTHAICTIKNGLTKDYLYEMLEKIQN